MKSSRMSRALDPTNTAHKGYLIVRRFDGSGYIVVKDECAICHAATVEDAKREIDALVGE